jgi:hypothetical protein
MRIRGNVTHRVRRFLHPNHAGSSWRAGQRSIYSQCSGRISAEIRNFFGIRKSESYLQVQTVKYETLHYEKIAELTS